MSRFEQMRQKLSGEAQTCREIETLVKPVRAECVSNTIIKYIGFGLLLCAISKLTRLLLSMFRNMKLRSRKRQKLQDITVKTDHNGFDTRGLAGHVGLNVAVRQMRHYVNKTLFGIPY